MGRFFIASIGLTVALLTTPPVSAFEFPALRQPNWHELSPQQKHVLAPLADEWDSLDDARRKKWIGIAARYPGLTPEEQSRAQGQMQEWANLSPAQRTAIREKYKALHKAAAGKGLSLREQWALYQQLPPEEKQRLQEEAARRKAERRRQALEKSRQATSVLSAKVLKPGYPLAPVQQAPAPVVNIAPVPVPAAPEAATAPAGETPGTDTPASETPPAAQP